MTVSAKDGNLVIESIDVPDQLEPGEEGVAEIALFNNATVIGAWDDDRCTDGSGPAGSGYKYQIEFRAGGETQTTGASCLNRYVGNSETREVTFTAPETAGTKDVEARLKLPGSGERSDWLTQRIEVYEPGDEPAEPPDDPDDSDGSGLPDWINPDDGSGGQIQLILAVILLFGAMYAAGNLFDINLGGA